MQGRNHFGDFTDMIEESTNLVLFPLVDGEPPWYMMTTGNDAGFTATGLNIMANVHTVTVNGKVLKRTSKSRTYTHCIIGQPSRAVDEANARSEDTLKCRARNFKWSAFIAAQPAGEVVPVPSWGPGRTTTFSASEVESAKAEVEGGLEAYQARKLAERMAAIEQAAAEGRYEPGALAWSGSAALAQREADKWARSAHFVGVRVVPVGYVGDF